jgi:hypothetical protein
MWWIEWRGGIELKRMLPPSRGRYGGQARARLALLENDEDIYDVYPGLRLLRSLVRGYSSERGQYPFQSDGQIVMAALN